MEWSATIEGRIASKKNSKRVFRNRFSGRTVVASSAAYDKWHQWAINQLFLTSPRTPITGPVSLTCTFHLKGKLDSDLDNMASSIADLLQDLGVIENDKHILHMDLTKIPGAPDFKTDIRVSPYEGL